MVLVKLFISSTLDGYIAREDGSVDFLDRFNKTGEDFGMNALMESIGSIVMGMTTFQEYSWFDNFYDLYKGKNLYVFSHNPRDESRVTFVNNDPRSFLKSYQSKRDIWLLGGAKIIESFHNLSLIDEYIITIIPIIIGSGIPLFKHPKEQNLELIRVEKFNEGVVNLHYLPISSSDL